MYCPNCGKEAAQGVKFCENCGVALPQGQAANPTNQQYNQPPPYPGGPHYQAPPPYGQPQPYYPPMYPPAPLKNAGIAAVLAFLWAGLGHIYIGQIGKGILYMALYIGLWVLGFIVAIFTFFGLLILVIPFIFWIWQIFDAYNLANQYNASVQQTGRAPW